MKSADRAPKAPRHPDVAAEIENPDLRILSLMLLRCESCRGLFVLPRRFASRLPAGRDLSRA